MTTFISCDWGTSAFRLRLVDAGTQKVLATIKTDQGIAAVYNEWKKRDPQPGREEFYSSILAGGVAALQAEYGHPLADTTIVISGMASSSIGMMELPYKVLPFKLDGSDVFSKTIPPSEHLPYQLLFISGAKTDNDVMRGEETKLVGCGAGGDGKERLIIMPGTHTKHAIVNEEVVTGFNTYMTGEMFSLLSTKSVLAASVNGEEKVEQPEAFFGKGVVEAADSHLLNSIFHVRTARLFEHHTAAQNFHYLSGLLIGAELAAVRQKKYSHITLLATGVLAPLYRQALDLLHIGVQQTMDADEALVAGQCRIFLNRQKA